MLKQTLAAVCMTDLKSLKIQVGITPCNACVPTKQQAFNITIFYVAYIFLVWLHCWLP